MTDAGPGFPLRFYSRFSDRLDPLLIDSVSDIGDKAQVPGSKLELLKTKYKKTKKKHPKPQNHAVALRAFCPPRGGSSERPGGVVGAPPRESVALAGLPSPPAKIPAADRQAPPPGPPTCPKVDSFSSSEWFPLPNTPLSILATPFPSGRHRSPLSCRLPPPAPHHLLLEQVEATGCPKWSAGQTLSPHLQPTHRAGYLNQKLPGLGLSHLGFGRQSQ